METEKRELIKKEFHHLGTNYFNTAYFGPSPYSAKAMITRAMQKELDPSFYAYNIWMGIPDRVREKIATLLKCNPDNIAHSTSVSDVINIVANGLKFNKGDRVVSINKDYPSDVLPWMVNEKHRPYEFKLLDCTYPTGKWLKENLPKQTKVFNVSHVTFDTGKKMDLIDLGKTCREMGVLLIIDATQSLGGLNISEEEMKYIDVLACASYKWMLGPYGHAFAYFSNHALELIDSKTGNWINSPNSKVVYNLLDYTTETLPGARKFDRGQTPNMLTMSCLEASLDFLNSIGLETIQKHNAKIRDYFLDNYPRNNFDLITPIENKGNILALRGKNIDPVELETELKHNNVDVSVREGNIRLSFHIFNSKKQVDTLIKALDI